MSQDDERLLEICKNVSNEQDPQRLTTLIGELNQELEQHFTGKHPAAEERAPQARGRSAA